MNIKTWPILFILIGTCTLHAQILNGDFETPVVGTINIAGVGLVPGTEVFAAVGATPNNGLTDFMVTNGDVSLVDAGSTLATGLDAGLFGANTGSQYAVLNGLTENVVVGIPTTVTLTQTGSAGTLAQTFTTTPGQMYQLSFAYRGIAVGALNGNPILDVNVSNSSNSTAPANGTLTAVVNATNYNTDAFTFVATGTSSVLSFNQANSGVSTGLLALDTIVLTPLPEPAQYMEAAFGFLALLILGRLGRELRRTLSEQDAPMD